MECGEWDLLCLFKQWVLSAGIEPATAANWTLDFAANILAELVKLFEMLRANLEAVFGIAGFAFGVWRWWHHREKVLHTRLAEYLKDQDRRLMFATNDVLQAIHRPGPSVKSADTLFAVGPLRKVLRRLRWMPILVRGSAETSVDSQLNSALKKIQNRLQISQSVTQSFYDQMSNAHLLKGAIAAARAPQAAFSDKRRDLDNQAIEQFRMSLGVPRQDANVVAKELLSLQLFRLEHFDQADTSLDELITLSQSIEDRRKRCLSIAWAKRYRAEIAQYNALIQWLAGNGAFGGAQLANALIQESLNLRAEFAPYRRWDAIEQAEMHYLSALIYYRLNAVVQGPQL